MDHLRTREEESDQPYMEIVAKRLVHEASGPVGQFRYQRKIRLGDVVHRPRVEAEDTLGELRFRAQFGGKLQDDLENVNPFASRAYLGMTRKDLFQES